MDSSPVFGSSEEFQTWKMINGRPSKQALESILNKVMKGGFTHPAILTSLMDALQNRKEGVEASTIMALTEKARPQDISPAIKASEILVYKGDVEAAVEVLTNNESKDSFHKYLALAEVYHNQQDRAKAVLSAVRALDHDPSCQRLYEILDEDSPMAGWRDRGRVQAAYEKRPSDEPTDFRLRELYNIYKDWFSGNKDSATDRLVNSQYYKNGDNEFLLASARMSVDEEDWRSAKMMYDRIVDSMPPYVMYEAAEAYISGHDPQYALDLYDRIGETTIRLQQGRITAYVMLGEDVDVLNSIFDFLDNEYSSSSDYIDCINALMDSGKLKESKSLLKAMERSNKNDPAYLVCLAKYQIQEGNLHAARITAKQAVVHSKNDISVKILSARIKFISGDIKVSEKECNKILAEDPDNFEALVLKKDILMAKGEPEAATEVCRKILDRNPTDFSTMLALSTALDKTGDSNGSIMILRKILSNDPSRDSVISVLRTMIELKMYREAMYLCYEVENTIPGDAMIRRLRGNAEYCLGEYVKASVSFAAAAEADPHDPVIWHSKGMADEARGDLESAEIAYNRAILLDLNESDYWISKAAIQEKFDDKYGAIESLNRAIELDPTSIYPIIRKAVILENASRYTEALYFVKLCRVTDPTNMDVLLMQSRILRESGSYNEAIEVATQAHNVLKNNDSALELANCYTASGRRSEAVRVIEQMMAENKGTKELYDALNLIEQGHDDVSQAKIDTSSGVDIATVYPEAAAKIAESMAAMGDYKGAIKNIDGALAASGDDLKYQIMKIGYLLKSDSVSEASDLVNELLRENPKSGVLHECLGDVKMAKAEYRGALQEYEKAISMGLSIPEVLAKKGDAQQGLGYFDRSIDTYNMAVNRDPDNRDIRFKLAEKLYDRGYLSRAETHIEAILEKNPEDVQAIILLTRVRKDSRKDAGVTEAYKLFRACYDPGDAATERMIAVLESAGHDEEAKSLRKKGPEPVEDVRIKRSVEKVLRRAYVAKTSPIDEDLLESMGYSDEQVEAIREYMFKNVEFGDIIPGSPIFQTMERQSNEVVMALGLKDLDIDTEFALEKVYVKGNFKDVDDAKRLIAYIQKAMTCQVKRDDTLKMVLDKVQGISIYEIMRACKVGVYQARQIMLLLGAKT